MDPRWLRTLMVLALVIAACGSGRPNQAAWLERWIDTTSVLPVAELLEADHGLCAPTLAALREARRSLIPTPGAELDPTVDRWLLKAERIFFECPPSEGFEQAYLELARVEAEIEALLP